MSGLLPGYADNTHPTLKTSGTNLYFSASGQYSGYFDNNHVAFRKFSDFDNEGYYVDPASNSVMNSVSFAGPIYRGAASAGYLNGQYGTYETSATPGVIYSIGGSYVPTPTTLGNMYGIGYSYSNFW